MKQYIGKKKKDKVAAVLILSFCVIALASVFTLKAGIDKIAENADNIPAAKKAPVGSVKPSGKESIPAVRDTPVSKIDIPHRDAPVTGGEETSGAPAHVPLIESRDGNASGTFIYPVDPDMGKISKGYSVDMVIYNKTLDQYMTHSGIDMEAPGGTAVRAAGDGIVTDVYTDDAYGITIEITHNNGYITKYSSLATDKLVEKGDSVTKGQVISNVGNSALYESCQPPHVHFELVKNGQTLDPSPLLH